MPTGTCPDITAVTEFPIALCYDPANSWATGYNAAQQNAAYNAAADALNREPELLKGGGSNHSDALNKRVTT